MAVRTDEVRTDEKHHQHAFYYESDGAGGRSRLHRTQSRMDASKPYA